MTHRQALRLRVERGTRGDRWRLRPSVPLLGLVPLSTGERIAGHRKPPVGVGTGRRQNLGSEGIVTDTATPVNTTADDEWLSQDATRVLALPVNRWRDRPTYGDEVVGMTYSNGTEAEIANDTAYNILAVGPMLRRVLEAGVRALRKDPEFDAYISALYCGDSDRVIAIEAETLAAFPPDPEPSPDAMTGDQVADVMIAGLHERYGVES